MRWLDDKVTKRWKMTFWNYNCWKKNLLLVGCASLYSKSVVILVSLLFLGLFYHFNDFSCFTPAAAHLKSAKSAKSQIVSQSIAFEDSSSIYLFRTKKNPIWRSSFLWAITWGLNFHFQRKDGLYCIMWQLIRTNQKFTKVLWEWQKRKILK